MISTAVVWSEQQRTEAALAQARVNYRLAVEQEQVARQKTPNAEACRERAEAHLAIVTLLFGLEPGLPPARQWLTQQDANPASMLEIAKVLVNQKPTEDSSWKLLAIAYELTGRHQEALEHFEKAVEEHPELALTHNRLAWLLVTCPDLRLRDPQRAITHALRAVELEPNVAWWWNTVGVAYYRAGDWENAIEALRKSQSLGWDDGFNSFFLSMAYRQLGQGDEARRWYELGLNNQTNALPIAGTELDSIRAEAEALLGVK